MANLTPDEERLLRAAAQASFGLGSFERGGLHWYLGQDHMSFDRYNIAFDGLRGKGLLIQSSNITPFEREPRYGERGVREFKISVSGEGVLREIDHTRK